MTNRDYPEWFSSGFTSRPVMAVFRGLSPAETVTLANKAWDVGVTQVEVPIESSAAVPSLKAAIAAGRDRGMRVGAGTIVSSTQLHSALNAGAAYAVSPGLDPDLIAIADQAAMPMLPGVATPSEILRALNMGFEWMKAFPASILGPSWFTAMRGPFPTVKFVGTGGLNAKNAPEYLSAGASVVGIGRAFGDPAELERIVELLTLDRVSPLCTNEADDAV